MSVFSPEFSQKILELTRTENRKLLLPEHSESLALARKEYRRVLLPALLAVKQYRGDEAGAEKVLQQAMAAEQWLQAKFPNNKAHEVESIIVQRGGAREAAPSLDQILDAALKRPSLISSKIATVESLALKMNIALRQVEGVLIPPDPNGPAIIPGEGNSELQEVRFANRLSMILEALRKRSVYTDDIVLHVGTLRPEQMRVSSYVMIEIPRMNAEILACDQVGEATFVSSRLLGADAYQRLTKKELINTPGVLRVEHRNDKDWLDGIFTHLEQNLVETKLNIKDILQLRDAIQKRFSPASLLTLPRTSKDGSVSLLNLKIAGKGLIAIASKFAVGGTPHGIRLDLLELCAKIWGVEHPDFACELKEARANKKELDALGDTPESWRKAFEDRGLSPQALLKLPFLLKDGSKPLQNLKIAGAGLVAIAGKFAVEGKPTGNRLVLLELCAKIWGEEHPDFACELKEARANKKELDDLGDKPESWRKAFKESSLSPQALLMLPPLSNDGSKSLQNLKVARTGLIGIAGKFAVKGLPAGNRLVLLELCAKIWGEEHPDFACELKEARFNKQKSAALGDTPESWRKAFADSGLCPQTLLKLPCKSMDESDSLEGLRIAGKGLTAIAGKFAVEGIPNGNRLSLLELCAKIWGEEHPDFACELKEARFNKQEFDALGDNKPESWRKAFEDRGLSPQALQNLPFLSKDGSRPLLNLRIAGKGLTAIARKFALEGQPTSNRLVLLELCAKIWGAEHPDFASELKEARANKKELDAIGVTLESWRTAFEDSGLSPQALLKLPNLSKDGSDSLLNLRIAGKGLTAIARKFAVEGQPTNNRQVLLELCAKIWGEEHKEVIAARMKFAETS